jgi:excisionase family DNA binding protein
VKKSVGELLMAEAEKSEPSNLERVTTACAELRISREHLYSGMRTGKVKVVHFGRAVRIPRAEIERLKREGF